jgi:uncharacterized protein (DUF58 family)
MGVFGISSSECVQVNKRAGDFSFLLLILLLLLLLLLLLSSELVELEVEVFEEARNCRAGGGRGMKK